MAENSSFNPFKKLFSKGSEGGGHPIPTGPESPYYVSPSSGPGAMREYSRIVAEGKRAAGEPPVIEPDGVPAEPNLDEEILRIIDVRWRDDGSMKRAMYQRISELSQLPKFKGRSADALLEVYDGAIQGQNLNDGQWKAVLAALGRK